MGLPSFSLACEVSWDIDALRKDCGAGLLDDRHVQTLVAASLFEAGAETGEIEVSVTFTGLDRIAALNEEHREVEGPTDVLSFPIDDLSVPLGPDEPRVLGDLVICPAYVERQVAEGLTMQGDPTLQEALERCIVHGALHLAGFDHERSEVDAREMLALEQLVLDRVRGART